MFERINQQDIINNSFKLSTERENEIIDKCKKYKNGNANKDITELIISFIKRSQGNLDKISELTKKLSLDYISKNKLLLTDLDKLQVLLKDKIQLQKQYNDLSIKNENPEVRRLFIYFRDAAAEDIYFIQQSIQKIISVEKPLTKDI